MLSRCHVAVVVGVRGNCMCADLLQWWLVGKMEFLYCFVEMVAGVARGGCDADLLLWWVVAGMKWLC